jgi:hypothetical protein
MSQGEREGCAVLEGRWLACSDPDEMLQLLAGRVSSRKLRLFVVAACRRAWALLTDQRSRAVVEAAERFADGAATAEDLRAAYQAAPGGQPAANVATCAGMAHADMAAMLAPRHSIQGRGPWAASASVGGGPQC